MKKLSLVTQTLITDFMHGLAFVLLGIFLKTNKAYPDFLPEWGVLALKVFLILFVAAPMIERFFFRKKFDVWDETAKEHRMEAREMTFLLIQIAMLLAAVRLMAGQVNGRLDGVIQTTMTIEAGFIFIVYGASQIFQSLCFVFLEKRGA